jgi:hypothetical protein
MEVFQDKRRPEELHSSMSAVPRDVYSLGLLQTDVIIGEDTLTAMVNTGPCLKVIGLDLAKQLNLPIKKDPQLHVFLGMRLG